MRQKKNKILKTGIILLLLILWEAGSRLGMWSPYLLPGPVRIMKAWGNMLKSGELILNVYISSRRVLLGFCCALMLVIICEGIGFLWKEAHSGIWKLIRFLQNIPPLSLIPLLILWVGIGEKSKVFFIAFGAFFPIFINVDKGLYGYDRKLLEVGKTFDFSRWELFSKIILPSAKYDILTGLRIGFGYSWKAIVGAEMLASSAGLGYMILDAQYMARTDRVMAGILTIGSMGYLFEHFLEKWNEKYLRKEDMKESGN